MAYDNFAYKYDNLAWIEQEDEQKREEKRNQARKTKLKLQRRMNFYLICAIIALSMAAYFMISKNVQVHESADRIEELTNELKMLESNTSQKIYELEQSVDLNSIEEIATTRLNMQRPEKYQIVYINVQTDDVTSVTANEVEGVMSRMGNMTENMKKNIIGIFDFGVE